MGPVTDTDSLSHVLAVMVGGPGGPCSLPHHQLLIMIKSGHSWLDTCVPEPGGGVTVSHLWIHVPSVAKKQVRQMPSLCRDHPRHHPLTPETRVAAQSLVPLDNQRCLQCASFPFLAGHNGHHSNTELTVSTNREMKRKTQKKES